jgi:3-deoxy-D-manno-octulosonic-acid transferase
MLSFFDHLFVQNQESKNVLDEMGLAENCSVSGDTRFDRVIEIAGNSQGIPLIEQFIAGGKAIVAGSTWKEDEEVLQKAFDPVNDKSLKLIIAPHEINEAHIKELKKLFSKSVLFSELSSGRPQVIAGNILIIDNIGMLSRLYRHAYITYVGGAFKKNGIHNVLEPAVYGKPVLFGPYFKKHAETIDLVNNGGAVSISNADDCSKTIQSLLQNKEEYEMRSGKSLNYVRSNMGATKKIMEYIQRNRLLTS